MDVVKSLKPGKNGTKRFIESELVTVRYRHDAEQQISYTYVERKNKPYYTRAQPPVQHAASVTVRSHYREKDLKLHVKQATGKWQPEQTSGAKRMNHHTMLALYEYSDSPIWILIATATGNIQTWAYCIPNTSASQYKTHRG